MGRTSSNARRSLGRLALAVIVVPTGAWIAIACGTAYGTNPQLAPDDSAVADASAVDGSSDLDAANAEDGYVPRDAASIPACAMAEAGPPFISVDGTDYCIDAREVTAREYLAFLVARGDDAGGQRADCVGNSFTPPPGSNTVLGLPVRSVDLCDAVGYCDWAGKRLCGAIHGGSITSLDAGTDPTVSQWFHACSHDGDPKRVYPYGPDFDAATCNSYQHAGGAPLPPETLPNCQGGYAGIYDMAGNVGEWEDACERNDAGALQCAQRGGDYNNGYDIPSTCGFIRAAGPTMQSPFTGFRCCSR